MENPLDEPVFLVDESDRGIELPRADVKCHSDAPDDTVTTQINGLLYLTLLASDVGKCRAFLCPFNRPDPKVVTLKE